MMIDNGLSQNDFVNIDLLVRLTRLTLVSGEW